MKKTLASYLAWGIALLLLLLAYRAAAAWYQPFRPPVMNLADRQAEFAVYLLSDKRTEQALQLCQRAVEVDPNSSTAHYELGWAYARSNQLQSAIDEFRVAIRCRPDWPAARVNLGILLGQTGRLEEAAAEFRAAGDDPSARHNLAITEQELARQRRLRGR